MLSIRDKGKDLQSILLFAQMGLVSWPVVGPVNDRAKFSEQPFGGLPSFCKLLGEKSTGNHHVLIRARGWHLSIPTCIDHVVN